jgi:hypothetical protein
LLNRLLPCRFGFGLFNLCTLIVNLGCIKIKKLCFVVSFAQEVNFFTELVGGKRAIIFRFVLLIAIIISVLDGETIGRCMSLVMTMAVRYKNSRLTLSCWFLLALSFVLET